MAGKASLALVISLEARKRLVFNYERDLAAKFFTQPYVVPPTLHNWIELESSVTGYHDALAMFTPPGVFFRRAVPVEQDGSVIRWVQRGYNEYTYEPVATIDVLKMRIPTYHEPTRAAAQCVRFLRVCWHLWEGNAGYLYRTRGPVRIDWARADAAIKRFEREWG